MTTYENVLQILRNRLNEHIYPENTRFPSDSELAEEFGLNKQTVNKAVSILVSEGYLKRGVRRSPTIVLRRSAQNSAPVILYVGQIIPPTQSQFLTGLQEAALNRGYVLSVMYNPGNMDRTIRRIQSEVNLKAIVASACDLLVPLPGIPILYFDEAYPEKPELNTLNCDNFHGGELIMQELIRCGHRKIAILTNQLQDPHMILRRNGMLSAMKKAGLKPDPKIVFFSDTLSERSIMKKYRDILKAIPDLTAIATDSDDTAGILLKGLRKQGIRVPEDIMVTGFGALEWADIYLNIPSIDQHPLEQGIYAMEILHDILSGTLQEPVHEITRVDLLPGYLTQQNHA